MERHKFIYSAQITHDQDEGGYLVRFREFPEAITQGETLKEALVNASDCLEETVANRISMGLDIPPAARHRSGLYEIVLPAQMAAKAALHLAMRNASISKVILARKLGCDEKEVRRLLDPHHVSKLPRIELALAALGGQLVVGLRAN